MRRAAGTGALVAVLLAACGGPPPLPPKALPPPIAVVAPLPVPPPVVAPAPLEGVKLGPMVVTVSDARTAQLFHVVDRLARSVASKSRGAAGDDYAKWAEATLPLDDGERAMLAYHDKLRKRRGAALDEAFYVTTAIDEAAKDATEKKLLLSPEAQAERALLEHFGSRVTPLLDAQMPTLEGFKTALVAALKSAAPLAAQLGRFCETSDTIEVRAFMVSALAPTDAGATWTGERLVVDVRPEHDEVPTFLHALFHAVLERRRGSFATGARKCDERIDADTMEEGVAYAFAPGLVHTPERDVLAAMVAEDAGRKLKEPFVRYERLGLALRTGLGSALEGGHDTLDDFLPLECDAWAKTVKP